MRRHWWGVTTLCLWLVFSWLKPPECRAGEMPSYAWQIERIELNPVTMCMTGFRNNDIPVGFQDAPWDRFPLLVDEVSFWVQQPPDAEQYGINVRVYIWNGYGQLRYYTDIISLTPGGRNVIPLGDGGTYLFTGYDDLIEAPPVLSWFDGPGYYVGFEYVSDTEADISEMSGHILAATDVSWYGYNIAGNFTEGFSDVSSALPGNFGVRSHFRTLCPIVGDVDSDCDVDENDRAIIQSYFTVPGDDIFEDGRGYLDLHQDGVIDEQDLTVVDANYSGDGVCVQCPGITTAPETIERFVPAAAHVAPDTLLVQNLGDGTYPAGISVPESVYTPTPAVPWLSVSPSSGIATKEGLPVNLIYSTETLAPGDYETYVEVTGEADNSPTFVRVLIHVKVDADFNLNGTVDSGDSAIFEACSSGPAIPYDPVALPPGCALTADLEGFLPADFDRDRDVDQDDFGIFQRKFTGDYGYLYRAALAQKQFPAKDALPTAQRIGVKAPMVTSFGPMAQEFEALFPTLWDTVVVKTRDGKYMEVPLRGTGGPEPPHDRKMISLGGIIIIAIIVLLLAIIFGPAIHRAYLKWRAAVFMANSSYATTEEGDRIREAIDLLAKYEYNPTVKIARDYLTSAKYYNPETLNGITVNHVAKRGKGYRACTLAGVIALHWELVAPENFGGTWDDHAKIRLALVLIGETQHMAEPRSSERQLQPKLMNCKKAIGWENESRDIQHGNGWEYGEGE